MTQNQYYEWRFFARVASKKVLVGKEIVTAEAGGPGW